MNFNEAIFAAASKVTIPTDAKVVFVSDAFAEEYSGGAELTTQAIIDASPYKVFKLKSKLVSQQLLEANCDKFWIFGNYTGIDSKLIPTIAANLRYGIVEYDYKMCKYRSPEKHASIENKPCDCASAAHGMMISAFMAGSKMNWWMSHGQLETYLRAFPRLAQGANSVISSVFSARHLQLMSELRAKHAGKPRSGWIVLGSKSWIKGADAAEAWCKETNKPYEVVWNLPYEKLLEKLAAAEGFAYLPQGNDTCPRMVIEAKLLGCKLHLNSFVQHAPEAWFNRGAPEEIAKHLLESPAKFWDQARPLVEHRATISGYTTTRNCVEQGYPFEASIQSMLGFCDEVCVVDGGSTDSTYGILTTWAAYEPKLKVKQIARNWNHPRFAVFDGMQKAEARKMCISEYCWQMDSDEIVHESDYDKIRMMANTFPNEIDLLALPVIEYWGDSGKVRVDVNPWKWRLSRNIPHITHGIPKQQQLRDESGELYSAGSDGCDYVHVETHEPIPYGTFYAQQADEMRVAALKGSSDALRAYEQWLNSVAASIPGVQHYSWFDLKRKVRTYRDYWSSHWEALFNVKRADTAANNMFFDKPWSQVADDEIDALAARMGNELGGWIFHSQVDFTKPTPAVSVSKSHPTVLSAWTADHRSSPPRESR